MRLIDIENKIKELIDNDINDPEIYNNIFQLSYYFFLRNKIITDKQQAEEVAHIVAEELYLKVYNGGEIHSWIGYINKSYQSYIRMWRRMNSSEIIDTTGDYELNQAIVRLSSSNSDIDEYNIILDKLYFEGISKIIDQILDRSKYYSDTKDIIDAKLSLILSLIGNRFISFNQSIDNKMYTNMLYNLLRDEIYKYTKLQVYDSNINNMSLLQLYTLSNISDNS